MKIYTVKDDKVASNIHLLMKLNSDCVQLHWSRSFRKIPSNILDALSTLEEYVESTIPELCGNARSELTEAEESKMLKSIKENHFLRESLGTGVVLKGIQANDVKKILIKEGGMDKIVEAIETGDNVVIF